MDIDVYNLHSYSYDALSPIILLAEIARIAYYNDVKAWRLKSIITIAIMSS